MRSELLRNAVWARVTPETTIQEFADLMSVRLRNALDGAGIRTVGECLQLGVAQVRNMKNVGATCTHEFFNLMAEYRERQRPTSVGCACGAC